MNLAYKHFFFFLLSAMDQFDNRSLLSPTPSSISHVRSPTYLQHHRGGGLTRDHRGLPSRHAPSGFKCSSPKEETSPFSENDFFVGRRWLFREIIDHFATDLPTNGGILIHGGPGTGKTSILKRLVHGLCGK